MIDEFDYVWVTKTGNDLAFATETFNECGILNKVGVEHLDGHYTVVVSLYTLINQGCGSSSQFFLEEVFTYGLAYH